VCSLCRPEYLESCYVCGHRFRAFESFFVVKRLMDRDGIENRWAGVKYGRCQDCPRPALELDLSWFGELRRRGRGF